MAVTSFMLMISLFAHLTEAADRPVLTLQPNWKKIFRKESIQLVCNVEATGQENQMFYWYKNSNHPYSFGQMSQKTIHYAEMHDAGSYQCSHGRLAKSDPVQLEISNDWLILQTNSVYEGDTLILRCHGWDDSFQNDASIFKANTLLSYKGFTFRKEKITREATGRYRCERQRWNVLFYTKEKADAFVNVYELFSEPALQLVESPQIEGDDLAVKCDTGLAPPRKDTRLQFAFYRDGMDVREFSVSDTYRVQSAQLEDSGYYSCRVRTASDTVRKTSKALSIQIQELFSEPALRLDPPHVTEADRVTLKCDTTLLSPAKNDTQLQFAFYKDGRAAQEFGVSGAYVKSVRLEDSGNYACEVKTANGTVRKRSKNSFIQIKAAYGQTQLKLSANEVTLGDYIVLSCESSISSLPICYAFYHNGTSIGNVTVNKKETAALRLKVASRATAGTYSCISDNGNAKQKQLSNTVSLLVIDPVWGVNIALDKAGEEFALGDSLTLNCWVERGTSPSFLWLHNGKPVEKDPEVFQLRDHGRVLHIDSLGYHHAGSYQCHVSNTASSNRSFSVISNTRDINIAERSPGEENIFTGDDDRTQQTSLLWSLLGVLLLVVVLSGVLFVYRHKVASIVPWSWQQRTPGPTFDKVRPRVGHIASRDVAPRPDFGNNVQEDYSNVPNMVACADGDVCYSYIHINRMQGSTDISGGQDELSVTYSAVKCSGAKMDGTETELYQNMSSRES